MNAVDKELLGKYYELCIQYPEAYYDARFPLNWDMSVLKNICTALGLDYLDGCDTKFYTIDVYSHGYGRTITFSDLLTTEQALSIVNLYLTIMELKS